MHSDSVHKNYIVQEMRFERGSLTHKYVFFWIFQLLLIMIRGHRYEHLKKIKLWWKLSLWHVFESLRMRWILSSQKWQKSYVFWLFMPNLPQLGLFHPYVECKSSFRLISIIKIVILEQSKQILQILKNKNSKIQKSRICKLNIYYS